MKDVSCESDSSLMGTLLHLFMSWWQECVKKWLLFVIYDWYVRVFAHICLAPQANEGRIIVQGPDCFNQWADLPIIPNSNGMSLFVFHDQNVSSRWCCRVEYFNPEFLPLCHHSYDKYFVTLVNRRYSQGNLLHFLLTIFEKLVTFPITGIVMSV